MLTILEQNDELTALENNDTVFKHQKAYSSSLIGRDNVHRRRKRCPNSNIDKTVSRKYHLPIDNDDIVRVCLVFFCNTFGISKSVLINAIQCNSLNGVCNVKDKRNQLFS